MHMPAGAVGMTGVIALRVVVAGMVVCVTVVVMIVMWVRHRCSVVWSDGIHSKL
jgi:hypothetical protein